uniref:Uncharacterized protein n=1 Tax=Clytia hemisphaerica TaxID=252671 RepID=A0A7M5WXL0_9CNID
MQWLLMDEEDTTFKPTDWGWYKAVGHLKPTATDKPLAPPEILNIKRCKCKPSPKNPCGTNLCSCRKNGLKCMSSCGGCHGEDCNNKKARDRKQYNEHYF